MHFCLLQFVNGNVYFYTVAEHIAHDSSHIDPKTFHNWSVRNYFYWSTKLKQNLSQETIPRSPHSVVSDNETVFSPLMVNYIKNLNVSNDNTIDY